MFMNKSLSSSISAECQNPADINEDRKKDYRYIKEYDAGTIRLEYVVRHIRLYIINKIREIRTPTALTSFKHIHD